VNVKRTPQKNGRTNIAIVEKYWKDGASRQRTVLGLGYLDLLNGEHGDGMAYAEALAKELTEAAAAEAAAVPLEIYPKERIDKRSQAQKNIGCALPLSYYNSLGIELTLRNHVRNRRFHFDTNAVMRLLVADRIVSPHSKLGAHVRRDSWFFRTDFTLDDIYGALDFFAGCKGAVVSAMNRAIAARQKRDLKDAYYDVTNYYFEIDDEDDLRKDGVSKEKRKKPIVQLGLLQDKDGIPLNFDLFAGNTQDCETLLPVLEKSKDELGLGHVVIVADKGLNTHTNIAACVAQGDGFVFSQSIRGSKSTDELRRWVLAESGWRGKDDEDDGKGFKIKSRQDTKTVHIEGPDSKKKDISIEVKIVAFWSPKYDARAKRERAKVLKKAEALVKDPSAYRRATHYGAAKYVNGIVVDKKTGEIRTEAGCVPVIDTKLLAKEEACDGYYCIVTSEWGLSDEKILDIYRGLWRIEEAFKVTKSLLKARPVFVWTYEHIKAHFLICYIALVIVRLMQLDCGYRYSADAILSEIAQMNGVHLQGNWWRFSHRTDLSDELCSVAGLDLSLKNMQLKDIKKMFSRSNATKITPARKINR
jgi:hypothetical protein